VDEAAIMTSYRLKRRHFVQGLGALVNVRLLLGNIEARAQGAPRPPRLLFVHWPGGTVHYHFTPVGTGADYTASRILQPFEDLGLRQQMSVIYGTSTNSINLGGGGPAEGGTVVMATGVHCPGTRMNGGESDDSVAGGPSFDQIFYRRVPSLSESALGCVNVICDARVDSYETSSRCLSYSYETRQIEAARAELGLLTEHVPLLPDESPIAVFERLFGGFSGGSTSAQQLLTMRQSVLDASVSDLTRLRTLVPVAEREKIDLHLESVRRVEQQLAEALVASSCAIPAAPDATLTAKVGNLSSYGEPKATEADDPIVGEMADLYFALIRTAFQCDVLRVATFQWAPSTNHMAFQGLYPLDPEGAYMHHPLGSRMTTPSALVNAPPADEEQAAVVEFLTEANIWFNRSLARALVEFKDTEDVFGGSLLDATVVPYMTEKAHMADDRRALPSILLGGGALGLQHGQYIDVREDSRSHNAVWMNVAQAMLQVEAPLELLADETFIKDDAEPLPGLWAPPA
jgi:hypothetical protein